MKNKTNETTELVFILDASGSMAGMENDTVGGFNSLIEKQKAEEGGAFVTTVFFSHRSVIVHDRLPLAEVEPLTEEQYRVGGSTALYDAIGGMIEHIEKIHKYSRPEDVPARTLFVITTDGEENSSRKYSLREVKSLIEGHEKDGWQFLFLGANIDAFSTAESMGIDRRHAAKYSVKDETGAMYSRVSDAVASYVSLGHFEEDWAGDLGEGEGDK